MTLPNVAALPPAAASSLVALELVVDLVRALVDQERAAEEQDEVAARHFGEVRVAERQVEQGRREAHHPADGEQQRDAAEHGQPEPERPRPRLLRLGQAARRGSR